MFIHSLFYINKLSENAHYQDLDFDSDFVLSICLLVCCFYDSRFLMYLINKTLVFTTFALLVR